MAKKKQSTGPNKAQIVRDAFKKLGIDASAKDVQEYAETNGVSVAAAQISNLRTKLKGGSSPSKGAKAKNGVITADELVSVRQMAEKLGGVVRAKELLDILAKLI
jgi:hypothetical protein